MRTRKVRLISLPSVLTLLLLFLTLPATWAQSPILSAEAEFALDNPVVTHHEITIQGKLLRYTARTGFLTLRTESHEAKARVFYIAYTLDNTGDSPRPLTFLWNGGPGASSSLTHLGAAGPWRAMDKDEYTSAPPPYKLVENQDTWLTATDLVFVDPVGTGYSYPTSPEFARMFYNSQGDIDSIVEFIRLYLTRYEAWQTPVYISGESYGTYRAAGMAEPLLNAGVPLHGVILVSTALGGTGGTLSDLPYVLLAPSYTAAAFAQKKLPEDLRGNLTETLHKSEEWAQSEYSVALLKGDRLTGEARDTAVSQMARFTGLDPKTIRQSNLRVSMDQFARQLLGSEGKFVGHYDSRITGKAQAGMYDPTKDPSLFTDGTGELIVPYLRNELGFRSTALYAGPFGGRWPPPTSFRGDWMSVRWDRGSSDSIGPDQTASLHQALRADGNLRVLVVSGYYDLATPYFATEYTFSHLGLEPPLRERVKLLTYEAGHAVYLDKTTRGQFTKDVAAFIESGLAESQGSSEGR